MMFFRLEPRIPGPMARPGPCVSPNPARILARNHTTQSPSPNLVRVDRRPDEQGRKERENVRLQHRHKQLKYA